MEEIFKLFEIADNLLKEDKVVSEDIISKIKLYTDNKGYIGIAQINTKVGDIEYNAKKIAKYIKFANSIGLESVLFPELSLTGFPLEDVISRQKVLVDENLKWLKGLANITCDTIALVGFIEPTDKKDKYYNSIAILKNGKIQNIVRKNFISTVNSTSDYKYFMPSKKQENIKSDCSYSIVIGDDYKEYSASNSKLIINCSANLQNKNRLLMRNNTLSDLAKISKTPIVYVNQVGANDSFAFDGISSVYNGNGELISRAKLYEEQLLIVNPYKSIGKIYPLPKGYDTYLNDTKQFSLDYENDLERTYKALIQGIKDYFNKCGLKRAVLGLSGGLDSTVSAVLLADAIGKENVFGVSMPSHITSSESMSDAEMLANNLGINFIEAPIRSMIDTTTETFDDLFKGVEKKWQDRYKKSFTPDNIQARSRAMILFGISNEFPSCIPIATSDKSEAYMGYATINGDMSGGFAPIADITKTKLFALARWLNKYREQKNVIPESIILKRPGAELAINPKTGKPLIAEDALMPYEFLDEIIWRIENLQQGYNEFLDIQFLYEQNHDVPKEQKVEWLDKFYKRMSIAFYKWSIAAPSVIIEPHSINKADYHQLITSSGINYKGVSEEYITESLN